MTIPSDILKTGVGFTATHPIRRRKRYTLSEILQGVTPQKMAALNAKTTWAREGKAIGREIEY